MRRAKIPARSWKVNHMAAPLDVDAITKTIADVHDLNRWEDMSAAGRKVYQDMGAAVHAQVRAAFDPGNLSAIITESLMGYAPGTYDNVRNGTWNARDDEIDTDAIATEIVARLLGEQPT